MSISRVANVLCFYLVSFIFVSSQSGCRVSNPRYTGRTVGGVTLRTPSSVKQSEDPGNVVLQEASGENDLSEAEVHSNFYTYCSDFWSRHDIDPKQVMFAAPGGALRIGVALPAVGTLKPVADQINRGIVAAAAVHELRVELVEIDSSVASGSDNIRAALCRQHLDGIVGPLDRDMVLQFGKHMGVRLPVVHFSRKFLEAERNARDIGRDGRLVEAMQTARDRALMLLKALRGCSIAGDINQIPAVSMIYVQNSYGVAMADIIRSEIGVSISYEQMMQPDLSDLAPVIAGLKMAAAGPVKAKTIVIISDVNQLRQIVPRLVRAGLSPSANGRAIKGHAIRVFATADGLSTDNLRPTDLRYLDGAVIAPGFFPDATTQYELLGPISQQLNRMPNFLEAVGYDAVHLATRLITSGEAAGKYVGLTATYDFNQNEVLMEPALYQVRSNRIGRILTEFGQAATCAETSNP